MTSPDLVAPDGRHWPADHVKARLLALLVDWLDMPTEVRERAKAATEGRR